MTPTLIPVPRPALLVVLARAESRATSDPEEARALAMLRIAAGLIPGCTDLRGSWRECSRCHRHPCPHGHQGGI